MSTTASTKSSLQQNYIAMFCGINARVESLNVTLDNQAGLHRQILING